MARWVIADDSRPLRLFFKSALMQKGQTVVADVEEGRAALEACREHRPDFVHLDLVMVGMSGADAARAIIAENLVAGCVIVVSSNTQKAALEPLAALGCAIITKPLRSHLEYEAAVAPFIAEFEAR